MQAPQMSESGQFEKEPAPYSIGSQGRIDRKADVFAGTYALLDVSELFDPNDWQLARLATLKAT